MTTTATNKRRRYISDVNMTFLCALLHQFPEWAIWLPRQGRWMAVRPPHDTRPTPNAPLIWVQASSASKLCDELRRAERRIKAQARARARELAAMDAPQ